MRVDDVASLRVALGRLKTLLAEVGACGEAAESAIVEAFVPGREVAVEGLIVPSSGGKHLRGHAIFDKPDPLDGPFFEETIYVTPSRLPFDVQTEIMEVTAWAAAAIGLQRGPVHAELRVNERGVCLIELAARPIGGLCSRVLRFAEGPSLEELVIMDALGMDTSAFSREPASAGVMMLPIPGEGILERVEGQGEAAMVPGIEQVMITAHPGERLVPFPEGSRYPGFVFARGDDPAVVEEALRSAHRKLRFVMRAPDVPATPEPQADAPAADEPVGSR